jgi:hypothetical protein
MDQKFGHFISKSIKQSLIFDFDVENKENFVKRLKFYDSILEKLVKQNYLKNSFIAGGGFLIKYDQNCQQSRINPLKYTDYNEKSNMHVYIEIIKSKQNKFKKKGTQQIDLMKSVKEFLVEDHLSKQFKLDNDLNVVFVTISIKNDDGSEERYYLFLKMIYHNQIC